MFCTSAGLLIDHELVEAISTGELPLLDEWSVELAQQWRGWRGDSPLVLLATGLGWHPAVGRDPELPYCCPLPTALRPLLLALAERLGARLVELDGSRGNEGLGRDDLLEAPLLLVATERPIAELHGSRLLREQPGQLLSLFGPRGPDGRLRRERWRDHAQVTSEALDSGLTSSLQPPSARQNRVWQPLLQLSLTLLLGLLLWAWSSRVYPGLLLICIAWRWLHSQQGLHEHNHIWCCEQLLLLQRLWADFGVIERVRDQMHEHQRMDVVTRLPLVQALQAHRLHLELERPRSGPWQRVDVIDALQLFDGLQKQLHYSEEFHYRKKLWLRIFAGIISLSLLLAAALEQSWTDVLILPTAALLALFNLQQPIPLLSAQRRKRALKALVGPVTVLQQAQRCDDFTTIAPLRMEVKQAVLVAGRELVDIVNDSL